MHQIYYTSRVQYSYIHGTVQNWADLLCTASQVVISFCRVALWNRIHKRWHTNEIKNQQMLARYDL